MALPIILKFEFTLEDMRLSQGYHDRAQMAPAKRTMGYLGAVLVAGACVAMAWRSHSYAWLVIPVLLFVMLVVIPAIVRGKVKRAVTAQLADHDEIEWRFEEDRLSMRRKAGEAASDWDVFTQIIQTPEGFLLYQGRSSFWLPVRAFGSPGNIQDFAKLARKKINDFKTVP